MSVEFRDNPDHYSNKYLDKALPVRAPEQWGLLQGTQERTSFHY